MTGGLGATNAMEIPHQIFGAARNLQGGGSLTMIATILVDTGSRMDEIIFQELKIPRKKLRGIFDRKVIGLFYIRSLTPQQAAGNALAVSVQLSVVYR